MPTRPPNLFSGKYLERAAHRRQDAEWLQAALLDPTSLVVPIVGGRHLISRLAGAPSAWFWEIKDLKGDSANLILLGEFRDRACFALEIAPDKPLSLEPHQEYADLMMIAGTLPADEAGVLAYARAMVLWRERHRYCGRCGSPTDARSAGHVLLCTNNACGHQQFPRIDPAIITLITDGERALLGRQAKWPPGRFSTIAGFVEPGESLEDAVVREVMEETGVVIDAVEYHSSQPWPFPSSLMVGFIAHAATTEIDLKDQELEEARWFTRADIATGKVALPPPTSVSFRLVEDWYDSNAPRPLRDEPGLVRWPGSRR
jgi:NAD+ diphosphatase